MENVNDNPLQRVKVDVLPTLVRFHDDMEKFAHHIQMVTESFDRDIARVAWKRYYDFYQNEIEAHLIFEEKVIFPGLLALAQEKEPLIEDVLLRMHYKNLLLSFKSAHQQIRSSAASVFQLFKVEKEHITNEGYATIFHAMGQLMSTFAPHARSENTEIVPLLLHNQPFAFMVGKLFLAHPGAYKERFRVAPER